MGEGPKKLGVSIQPHFIKPGFFEPPSVDENMVEVDAGAPELPQPSANPNPPLIFRMDQSLVARSMPAATYTFRPGQHLIIEENGTFIHLGEISQVTESSISIIIADTYGIGRVADILGYKLYELRDAIKKGEPFKIPCGELTEKMAKSGIKLAEIVDEAGVRRYKIVSSKEEIRAQQLKSDEREMPGLLEASGPGAKRAAEIDLAIAGIDAEIKGLEVRREAVWKRLWNTTPDYVVGAIFPEGDPGGEVHPEKTLRDNLKEEVDRKPRQRESAKIDQQIELLKERQSNLKAAREAVLAGRSISGMAGTDREPCLMLIVGEERHSDDNSLQGRIGMLREVAIELIDQKQYEKALGTLMGTTQAYAAIMRDSDGNGILATADGRPTLTARINDMMARGMIGHNPPFVLTSVGLCDASFRKAIEAYNHGLERERRVGGVLSERFGEVIRMEDIDAEATRLAVLESGNLGAAIQFDGLKGLFRRLDGAVHAEELHKQAREFWKGTLDVLLDPSTLVMIAAGQGAGMITRGLLLRLGMAGVRGLAVRGAALAFEGALFHTFNNLGQMALAPGVENPNIKWDLKSFVHSIGMISWMKGFSGGYATATSKIITGMAAVDPVLAKITLEMGSLAVEAAGFASFDDLWGRYVEGQSPEKEAHERFAETMQMVLAFRGMRPLHMKQGAERDQKRVQELQGALEDAQGKVAEMKERVVAAYSLPQDASPVDRAVANKTIEDLRSKEAEVVKLELEYLKVKEREIAQLLVGGKISREDRDSAVQAVKGAREKLNLFAERLGLRAGPIEKSKSSGTIANLEADADGFYRLNSFTGLISSAMRADTVEGERVGLDGFFDDLTRGEGVRELEGMLGARNIPIRELRVEDDINQTSDPNRSVVELTSNGFDAGGANARVAVNVRNGRLEVIDNGPGMDDGVIITRLLVPKLSGKPDPSKQIGRFGIGFFTALRHLKADGDRVTVTTETASGAHEIVFEQRGGELCVRLRSTKATGKTGTKVVIESKDIREDAMRAEVDRYLRYADAGRLMFNGEAVGDAGHLAERRRVAYGDDAEGRVLMREGGERRGIAAMKVGGVIVEQYDSEHGAFGGEVVLEVPSSVGLTITRDQLIVDKKLVSFMEHVISGENDLAVLNSLAPLVTRLDARNDTGRSMLELLRTRTSTVVDKQLSAGGERRVYPSWMHGRLRAEANVQYVDGRLFDDRWWNQFDTPAEFQGGQTIDQSGTRRSMRVLVSSDMDSAWHYDAETGTLFLADSLYGHAAGFALSAFFMIKGLDFGINWGRTAEKGARDVVAGEKNTDRPTVGMGDGGKLQRFLDDHGIRLENLGQRFDGRVVDSASLGGNFLVVVQDRLGTNRLQSASSGRVFLEGNMIRLIQVNGRVFVKEQMKSNLWRLYELTGGEVCRILESEKDFGIYQAGDRLLANPTSNSAIDNYDITDGRARLVGHKDFPYAQGGRYFDQETKGDNFLLYEYTKGGWRKVYEGKDAVHDIANADDQIFAIGNDGNRRYVLRLVDGEFRRVPGADGDSDKGVTFHFIQSKPGGTIYCTVFSPTTMESVHYELVNGEFHQVLAGKYSLENAGNRIFARADEGSKTCLYEFVEGSLQKIFEVSSVPGVTVNLDPVIIGDHLYISKKFAGFEETIYEITPEGPHQIIKGKSDAINRLMSINGQPLIVMKVVEEESLNRFIVLHNGTRELLRIENNSGLSEIKIRQDGGETFVVVQDGMGWSHVIPYSHLLARSENSTLQGRWRWVQENRVQPAGLIMSIASAGDEAWAFVTGHRDSRFRRLLPQLGNSTKEAYLLRHREESFDRVDRALRLITALQIGVADGEVLEKVESILRTSTDINALLRDLESGRKTPDTEAVRLYMRTKGSLPPGEYQLSEVSGSTHRLADVVTHLRLGRQLELSGRARLPGYKNEEDERQVLHALGNLYTANPHAYIREMLQNALDVQRITGRVAEGDHRVEVRAYDVHGRAVVSFRDYGGMTENEFKGLLQPGEGAKRGEKGYLGGFGVGFFSILAGSQVVRLRTAVRGSDEVIEAEFRPVRKAGKIVDVELTFRKVKNSDGFYGTMIESERSAEIAAYEGAQFETRVKDIGQYVSNGRAEVSYNGEVLNSGRNGPLVEGDVSGLGHVAIHDGLENRLLLGGLPLCDLPASVWIGIPDVVRRLYDRVGFYVDLDASVLLPTPTRDRLRDHDAVLAKLKEVLPAMLIQGFLKRVADPSHLEDLRHIPEVYFIDAYGLAGSRVSGTVSADATAINEGRWGNFKAEHYSSGKEGDRNLMVLLTLVKFINIEGEERPLSIRDIHQIHQKALRGDAEAVTRIERIKQSPNVPDSIKQRLEKSEGHEATKDFQEQRLASESAKPSSEEKFEGGLKPGRKYDRSQIKDRATGMYLDLLKRTVEHVWLKSGGKKVQVGVHTTTDGPGGLGAFGLHYANGKTYHLYRSFGTFLDRDVAGLSEILSETNPITARARFDKYMGQLFDTATHELTHVLREEQVDATHDVEFYRRQRDLIAQNPFTQEEADALFEWARQTSQDAH